ncbi:MAG: ATP-binding protein [Bacteroides sp.]|nr:ATP-binding protein [Bacteroides sp.]MCM1085959.1 ATP-binding protein [Bacteroides sp.]
MLVNFTVKNYRSFKDERTFSMESSSIKEHKASVLQAGKLNVLPLAVFYGANSSGKSNLLQAIFDMRTMVLFSVRLNNGDTLPYSPFALDETSETQPTFFEIQFIKNNVLYRYGFEYNKKEIISEWLYEKISGEREYELFIRSHDAIEVSKKRFAEGIGKDDLTNTNRLFLSLVAQLKGQKSNLIMDWFSNCNVLSGTDSGAYKDFSTRMFLEHLSGEDEAQAFFNTLQLGFTRFSVKETDIPQNISDKSPISPQSQPEDFYGRSIEFLTTHNIYNEDGVVVGERNFHKNQMESEGTKKIIEIAGPLFNSMKEGKILIVDELDAKLHPLLTRNIVLLFMNPEVNKHGAQLIFATHDTNLLDLRIIRRDQIWFAEKDKVESTDIYSLVEFKDEDGKIVRNDRDIKRDYLKGRYGAIPFIGK